MVEPKKEDPWPLSYEKKLRYDRTAGIEKHLDNYIEANKEDVQREIQNAAIMHTDAVYDAAKAALSDAKEFGGATKHGKHPMVVHLKNLKGDEKRAKAHKIIEKIVAYGLAESYRENGKELDAKAAEAYVKRHLGDEDALDKHLKGHTDGKMGYDTLIDALLRSDNILADLRNPQAQSGLGQFLAEYTGSLNKLQQAIERTDSHIQRSYNEPELKAKIDAYTNKKAELIGQDTAGVTKLGTRLTMLRKYARAQYEQALGEKEVKAKKKT